MKTAENRSPISDEKLSQKLEEIRGNCTSISLKKATRAISHIVDSYVRPTGLRSGQFGVLIHVANQHGVTVSDLADSLVMDITTLSRNIRLLERDGYVTISAGKDRRVRQIELTECGMRKIAEVLPLWETAQESIKQKLGEENWGDLIASLHNVAAIGCNNP